MKRAVLGLLLMMTLATVGWTQRPASALPSAPSALPSEQTVMEFLRQTFGYDANIQYKVIVIRPSGAEGLAEVLAAIGQGNEQQTTRLFITADGQHAIAGEMMPFGADPYVLARQQLQKGQGARRGPENAPLTIVEFSDLQCPACKAAQPLINKLLADNPDVRFVFQHFPLPMHPWAETAAVHGQCVWMQNKDAFWKYVDAVYAAQEQVTVQNAPTKLVEIAAAAGADPAALKTCAAGPEAKKAVKDSMELGQSMSLSATPTLFIGGRMIRNVNGTPPEVLDAITKFMAKVLSQK